MIKRLIRKVKENIKSRNKDSDSTPPPQGKPAESSPRKAPHSAPAKARSAPRPVKVFDGQMAFRDLPLHESIQRALDHIGFIHTTPIQAATLPDALAGRDINGRAQTGTGKTAAFLITIYQRCLANPRTSPRIGTPRALVISPTRELTMQIYRDANDIGQFTGCRTLIVFGGMDFDKQARELRQAPFDLLIATPGRLLDFVSRKMIDLRQVEILVIDEADRMLDMGFIPDVRRIVRQTPPPGKRQTMLFSATLTPEITRLAAQWMRDPVNVEIQPETVAADSVDQKVYITTTEEKFTILYNTLKKDQAERVIVFCNRRDIAEDLTHKLTAYGLTCRLLSGAVPQDKRVRVLEQFRSGQVQVLVATDVAGRGLHIEGVSHVVNFNLPEDPEDYVHRIGRTGRAGAVGVSISFACENDAFMLPEIEKYLGHPLKGIFPDDDLLVAPPDVNFKERQRRRDGRRPPGGRPRGGRPGGRGGGRGRPPRGRGRR